MITNEYGVADRQRDLLQLMKDADQIMRNNSIDYSLCGGTLLGAIRHKGFIPWDDDLDIMFDRDNFNKLIDLFNSNNNVISVNDSCEIKMFRYLWIYRIQKNDNQEETIFVPTIDIFVMDNCPDNVAIRKLKVGLIKTLQGMMHQKLELSDKSFLMKVCLLATYGIGKVFTDCAKYKMYNRISEIGNKKRTQYITGYNDLFNLLNLKYAGNIMDKTERCPFEDIELPITSEYDNYLSTQYGDYMTPPPVDERLALHVMR